MNEPAVFNESKTFDENVIHVNEDGEAIEHRLAHNAYSYFQALATFDALKEVSDTPFVLTRAGFSGIQRYAAVWSGDSVASWGDMKLQIPLLLGLSISGVPFVGCDIGGFLGRSDPELLARYYQMATFFPLFRNHKAKEGNDQEPFRLPSKYQEKVKKAISLRYSLLPYLYSLAYEAHRYGHPIIRPLAYEFQQDENAFEINDQYMVGKYLLYAPIVEKGKEDREIYLPEGKWMSWQDGAVAKGGSWVVSSSEDTPLYVRRGSIIPCDQRISVWGPATFTLYDHKKEFLLRTNGSNLRSSNSIRGEKEIEFRQAAGKRAYVDNIETETRIVNNSTLVNVSEFKEISLDV